MTEPTTYCIHIKGHLDPKWSDWFDGISITWTAGGETNLIGSVPDQAALHGLLGKVRNLGLTLLAVTRCQPETNSFTVMQIVE